MQTSITAQATLLQVKSLEPKDSDRKIGARRKAVKTFTRASRKNLLDLYASMNITKRRKMVFMTLTYGQDYPDPERAKEHLEAFFKRLDRIFPNAKWCGTWRMEFQERGAPHFHLLLFNLPFLPSFDNPEKPSELPLLPQIWSEVIGIEYCCNIYSQGSEYIEGEQSEYPDGNVNDYAMTDIELVTGHKMAMAYVAKYMAKGNEFSFSAEGRRCFNFAAYPAVAPENTDPKPSAGYAANACNPPFIGRFWGVIHNDRIPYAPRFMFDCNLSEEEWQALINAAEAHYPRLFVREIDGQEVRIVGGFTLYVNDALRWLEGVIPKQFGLLT